GRRSPPSRPCRSELGDAEERVMQEVHEALESLPLRRPDLLRQAMLIDGAWVQADDGRTMDVRNPSTGKLVARVPNGGAAETRRAVAAAAKAMAGWRSTLAKERSAVLRRLYDLMLEHIDDLAVIMTAEQGKPLAEARGETLYAAGFIE